MPTQDQSTQFEMLPNQETHLFVLRVWACLADAAGPDRSWRWCGKLQEVLSSRGGYFGDWETLVGLIQEMLPTPQPGSEAGQTGEGSE